MTSPRVALLRGINVGGHRKLPMADLRVLLAAVGFGDVQTYIQSGNAMVTGGPSTDEAAGDLISTAISDRFGYDVPVVVRDAAVLPGLLGRSAELFPVVDEQRHDKWVHVAFLSAVPTPEAIASIDPNRSPGDTVVVDGDHAHLRFGAGAGTTKLTGDYLERTLRVAATMRNLATIRKLVALSGVSPEGP